MFLKTNLCVRIKNLSGFRLELTYDSSHHGPQTRVYESAREVVFYYVEQNQAKLIAILM